MTDQTAIAVERLIPMVVDVVSNDYESYTTILTEVSAWAVENELVHSVDLIRNAINVAMTKEYIRAYDYSEKNSNFEPADMATNSPELLYFLATKLGQSLL